MADIEITGLERVLSDFGRAAAEVGPEVKAITEANGKELEQAWRANARLKSGTHGKWYPSAITSEVIATYGAAVSEIGPETRKKQGGMGPGFEYGSVHQPPHLDGTKAAKAQEPKYASEIESAAAGLL